MGKPCQAPMPLLNAGFMPKDFAGSWELAFGPAKSTETLSCAIFCWLQAG